MKNLNEQQKKGYKMGKVAAMVEHILVRTGNQYGTFPKDFELAENMTLLKNPFLQCGMHALQAYGGMPCYKQKHANLLWSVNVEDFDFDYGKDGWQSFRVAFRKDRAALKTERYAVGLKLHQLRIVRNLSTKVVASWAGITENNLRAIERGAYAAKLDQISALLGALRYSFSDIIDIPEVSLYDIKDDYVAQQQIAKTKKPSL